MADTFSSHKKNFHIIFDLDGTLIDSVGGIHYAMNSALHDLGLQGFEQSYYRNRVGRGAHELTKEISDLIEHVTLNDLYTLYQSYYEKHLYHGTHVYEGIPTVLNALDKAGLQLSVLTNKVHKFAEPMVKHFFPSTEFCSVNGVQGDGLNKPQLQFIHRACPHLTLPDITTVFVGDTPIDIECAKVSNNLSIAVTWGYCAEGTLAACQPDYLVHHPDELQNVIESLTLQRA